jgi:hypothetical protein
VTSSPAPEPRPPIKKRFLPVLGWGSLAAVGGAIIYSAFALVTGMETSLIGIPVGLAVGQAMYFASRKRGGRRFQVLAVFLAFAAFDLSYAPGMAAISFKDGFTIGGFLFLSS